MSFSCVTAFISSLLLSVDEYWFILWMDYYTHNPLCECTIVCLSTPPLRDIASHVWQAQVFVENTFSFHLSKYLWPWLLDHLLIIRNRWTVFQRDYAIYLPTSEGLAFPFFHYPSTLGSISILKQSFWRFVVVSCGFILCLSRTSDFECLFIHSFA
jgi:hypothetical protein